MAEPGTKDNIYLYQPNHVVPAVFAALIGISLIIHTYQNFHYRFWRVTFFLFYAGTIFTIGFISRVFSSYHPGDLNLYIVQTVFILAAPPIYAAAEYNILSRLMDYIPMHAPLHPRRVYIFFVYLGVGVESLTAAGGSMIATNSDRPDTVQLAGKLISVSLVLQAIIQLLFISLVATLHTRCITSNMLTPNIRNLTLMLYGTSSLILLRCIYRAIDSFATDAIDPSTCTPGTFCASLKTHEWPLYAFDSAPMLLYTYWLNLVHPGRLLPSTRGRYLDVDGKTERMGPGWIDRRNRWGTFVDPLDLGGLIKGQRSHERFWEDGDKYTVARDGSFALGTASNVGGSGSGSDGGGNGRGSGEGSSVVMGLLGIKRRGTRYSALRSTKGGEASGSD